MTVRTSGTARDSADRDGRRAMAANEYEWLKRADDGRWTNARKRDALMAAAEAGDAEAKARAIEWRMADEATAVRLAEVKRSVAAAGRELGDAAAGRNADRVLAAAGSDGVMRTALGRTLADSGPDAVERRLRHRLMEVSRRLADCRRRVADKAAGTVRLQHALVEARGRAVGHHVVVGCDSAAKEDVIRLGDLEARRARDLISENVAMMDALNEQLAADVRTQAAAIVKVLACGLSAQQDAAVYQQRLCRARQQHTDTARRENAREKAILAKTAKLEYTRYETRGQVFSLGGKRGGLHSFLPTYTTNIKAAHLRKRLMDCSPPPNYHPGSFGNSINFSQTYCR